jgi:iron complex outermembrane receptor protein
MAKLSKYQNFFNMKPVSRAVLAACGGTIAAGTAPAVVAQEVAALEEIIVTARKRAQNLQDAPVSVMAFGADKIAKQGIASLEDYARLIPSLTYSSWLPGSSIVVFRGVTVTADAFSGNSSAATYFNDMTITSQGANPEVAIVDMDRIEAVSGPQPTTYGASAQSGVLKFVTAKPDFEEFGGYVDVSTTFMEEGDSGYNFEGVANIPVNDKFALRVVGFQTLVGGFVDNIEGSTADTHDWQPAWDSPPSVFSGVYGGVSLEDSGIAHVTKTNHDVAEDNIGDITTQGIRLTGSWAAGENWLITGMYNYQNTDVDGIGSWNPEFGDLNQIRFNKETKNDKWYMGTLVIEGDLGFADFTSATGYMERDIVYDLDQSTYLHQFQGVGAVYYNMWEVAYPSGFYYGPAYNTPDEVAYVCPPTYAYCYVPFGGTVAYASYSASITGWEDSGYINSVGDTVYYITELTDGTSRMYNADDSERFTQELRLTSKGDGRLQWMVGGYYEKYDDNYVFRGIADNFGNGIIGQILEDQTGLEIRSPGQSWYGTGPSSETQWAVFGELGFDITDNLNLLVGFRYFEAKSETTNTSLNGDGTVTQNCLENALGVCITDPANITPDNRVGTFGGNSSAEEEDTLPLMTLSWAITENVLSYFTYSEGYRIGGTNLLRATSTANEQYLSDKLYNNEIGLKMTLMDGRFTWNMAAYQMTWEDMQLVAADPTIDFGWGQVTVNAGEAEINGFETNFAFAATDGLTFDGALTWTDSEVIEGASIGGVEVISVGEQLPLSPELKYSLGAEFGFAMGNSDAYLRLDYSFTDEQTNGTQGSSLLTSSGLLRGTIATLPSYSIANVKFGWGTDKYDLSFALNNIADERAITYKPTRWADGRLYSVRPRELVMRYRYNF